MKKRIPWWLVASPVITLIGVLGAASFFVWLPDVISKREVVVAAADLPDRGRVELTQLWAGDGYMTSIRHRASDGTILTIVGDADTRRAWDAAMVISPSGEFIRIKLLGREWQYYHRSHTLHLDNGQTREP